ncbi:MAG TPA: hypothetical protein VKG89_05640 [Solirubrobacterales bacterium]|nr:hypothetical protein [Solirubrobacterales bacterium]
MLDRARIRPAHRVRHQLPIIAGVLAATCALPGFAPAAFPGRNGKIAFVHGRKNAVYTMRPNGSHERLLVRGAREPAFSSDGRRILFSTTFVNPNLRSGIYTVRSNGTHLHRIRHTSGATAAGFAPSGKEIAFVGSSSTGFSLYTIRIDGSHKRGVTDVGIVGRPVFSPDGKWITFSEGGSGPCNIALVRPNGTDERLLTDNSGTGICDNGPDFSPSGRKIVFNRETGFTHEAIYTINMNGTGVAPLYQTTDTVLEDPVFSPTGGRIAFSRRPFDAKFKQIYRINSDGAHLKKLSHSNSQHTQPSWGVRR